MCDLEHDPDNKQMRHRHIMNPSSFPRFRLTRPDVINLATSLLHDVFSNHPQQFRARAWARQFQWAFQIQHVPRQATPLVMIQSLDVRSNRIAQRGFVRQFRWSYRCHVIRRNATRPFENLASPDRCDSFSLVWCDVSWFRRLPCLHSLVGFFPTVDKITRGTQNQKQICQYAAHVCQTRLDSSLWLTMGDVGDLQFHKKGMHNKHIHTGCWDARTETTRLKAKGPQC